MGSEPFIKKIGWQVAFIGLTSLATAYLWFGLSRTLVIFPLLLLIFLLIRLFQFLQRTNQDLALFFEGLLNEDSSITLEPKAAPPGYEYLSKSLLRLSKAIQDERVQNRFQQQFYEELISHSTSGLLAYDEIGQVRLVNPPVLNFLGLHHLSSMKTIENRFPAFYQSIHHLLPGKTIVYRLLREGETLPLQIRSSLFSFGEKRYRLLAFQNIKTELDEKEVESWQNLFRILSHEIMNSIAPITSLAQTISRSLPREGSETSSSEKVDYNRIKRIATTIEEQSNLMMSFVEKYRKLYKIPEPDIKAINVEDWLTRFRILYHQEMLEKGIRFDVQSSEVDNFHADDNLISQVIVNLLRNAQQALSGLENGSIRLSVSKNGEYTNIVVEDNGTGIPEEYANQIFIPFFTTNPGGNGIGLAISRQIVLRHGGTITFSSVPEKGTKFCISI
ncbi:MAG: HAMP domain-containing sensor histidine kinase [Bacteroidia bacterium]|nr:HAMP domain-containing sensor histidine kinase [Bacteroidia bacterium]